jgi:signal transduction histidine kinase
MYFCRPDGTVFWRHVIAPEGTDANAIAALPDERFAPDHPLMKVESDKNSHVSGLMKTEMGLVLVAARPILTSTFQGPRAGVLIWGRLVNEELVAEWQKRTGVKFALNEAVPTRALEPTETLISSSELQVAGTLSDISGAPVTEITTTGPRSISQKGLGAIRFASLSLVGAGLFSLLMLHLALRGLVISPLARLTRHAALVGESGRSSIKLDTKRGDEIGTLSRVYEQMLRQLEELRVSAMAASRDAGKAEVAVGVLHNVGNAMTGVSVLAQSLSGRVSQSRALSLSKVAGALNENRGDLPGYFARGGKGEQLVEYIVQLSEVVNREAADVQRDVEGLRSGLAHIREIVAAHQDIANSANLTEDVDIGDVAAHALSMLDASLKRHGVEAVVRGSETCIAVCDRSKLSQVIVNLLTNAKEALLSAGVERPRIELSYSSQDGKCWLEISDNGPGISVEARARLYQKGFTTKCDGHGIGLHYCALTMREMQGSVELADRGKLGGATFRIEVPAAVLSKEAA